MQFKRETLKEYDRPNDERYSRKTKGLHENDLFR